MVGGAQGILAALLESTSEDLVLKNSLHLIFLLNLLMLASIRVVLTVLGVGTKLRPLFRRFSQDLGSWREEKFVSKGVGGVLFRC